MPPITRRRAKAQADEESIASAAENDVSFQENIPVRSRRKAASKAEKADKENATDDANSAATPKAKRLEVRIRSEKSVTPTSTKTEIEVHIPSSAVKTPRSRSSPVPDSQDTTASQATDRTFDPLSASKQLEEEAIRSLELQSRLREANNSESTPVSRTNKSIRASSGKKNARGNSASKPKPAEKDDAESEGENEKDNEATPKPKAAAKSTHVVFGDDDDVDKFVAAAAEKEKDAQEAREEKEEDEEKDEEEDSDDEAPEAVSTAAAAKDTMKSARAAIEAAEKYAAEAKRKRQEREILLKEQAEKRKRKRQRKPKGGDFSDDDDDDENENEKEGEGKGEGEGAANPAKRQRRTKGPLPDMLPEEFLTDSSSDDDDDEDGDGNLKRMVKRKKPKKLTFETALQTLDAVTGQEVKGPRDEVVGSTRYRVLGKPGDEKLAPRINKDSRRAKEALMRRGRQPVVVNKKKGFFVKR